MDSEKVMCGVLLKRVQDLHNLERDPERMRAFMIGFWAGQAEKVYLGWY